MKTATTMEARSRIGRVLTKQSRSMTRQGPLALRETIRRGAHRAEAR